MELKIIYIHLIEVNILIEETMENHKGKLLHLKYRNVFFFIQFHIIWLASRYEIYIFLKSCYEIFVNKTIELIY